MSKAACRYCDRTDGEVAACRSTPPACSQQMINAGVSAIFRSGRTSGNYVANKVINPTKVTFANGRTVKIVKGHLVVGWKP